MDDFSGKFEASYGLIMEKLGGWLETFMLNIPNIFLASLIAVIAFFLSKYVKKLTVKTTKKFTSNKTVLNLIANLTSVVFTIIVLFLILSIFNLDGTINKILATAGVLGLAVGLALQDPITNLFSGVAMSVRKLYKLGDVVETNGHFGVIKDIDLRSTRLRTPDGRDVVIPNRDVIQNPLQNYSSSGERRVEVSCGVSYGEDLSAVEKIAHSAISSLEGLLENKPVEIFFKEFGGSSIDFSARFWIKATSQKDHVSMTSSGVKAIKSAFDENDIMIPYPIRTLDFGIKGGVPLNKMVSDTNKFELNNNTN